MKRVLFSLLLLPVLYYLAGCATNTDSVPPSGGLKSDISHFVFTMNGTFPSSEQARPAFDEEVVLSFSVKAIGKDGADATDYSGLVRIRPTSGVISSASGFDKVESDAAYVRISSGQSGDLSLGIKWAMGNGQLVAEEMIEDFYNPYQRKNMDIPGVAVGLSPTIYFCAPSIANVQRIMAATYDKDTDKNALNGRSVLISYGTLVVTGYTRDGFFATDVSEPDLAWASVYVYTWRSPYVDIGSKLRYFSGQVSDFYGFTEISSFPDWQVVGEDESLVPAPHLLGSADFADADNKVEPYESGLVRAEELCVLPADKWKMDSYYKYGQWPVGFDCTKQDFVIVSRDNVPNFDPYKCAGKHISFVQGNLRQHVAAGYMIIPRMEDDIDTNCD